MVPSLPGSSFPSAARRESGLIGEAVASGGAPAGLGLVDGVDSAEDAPGPRRTSDHPRLPRETEDHRVALSCSLDPADAVQGVAAKEDLQVPGSEPQGLGLSGVCSTAATLS